MQRNGGTFTDVVFESNEATYRGGAVHIKVLFTDPVTFIRTKFRNNKQTSSSSTDNDGQDSFYFGGGAISVVYWGSNSDVNRELD